jgi:peptide/nickel transport system substrate-binding protein
VLRDWRFRQALNYAINKENLCELAYNGLAEPGTTVLLPGIWSNPDYHWQPSTAQTYTFDLAKASQMLSAAGYPLKNGVRLNKQGKPIALRLETATDLPDEQTAVKLIAGWLQQLGMKVTLSVVDSGTLEGAMTNMHGQDWAPDFDLVAWGLTGNYDPGQTMDYFTTSSIGLNNTYYWSDPAFDRLALAQASAVDPQKRAALIWRMQQIMYQQSPDIIFAYPDSLEAINTARWTGWEVMFGGAGPAWQAEGNIQSYLHLRPVAATTSSGGSSSLLIAAIVVVAIVVASVAFVALRRRRPAQVEE